MAQGAAAAVAGAVGQVRAVIRHLGAGGVPADVPTADVHLLDGGHFVLDTAADDVAALVRGFLQGGDL
jgi:hypothetical protein